MEITRAFDIYFLSRFCFQVHSKKNLNYKKYFTFYKASILIKQIVSF
jgi:hypothetical protein